MEDKQATRKRKCSESDLNCSLCAKFVKILKRKSEDGTIDELDVLCEDCGSDNPIAALCITCTSCLCEDCYKYHRKKNRTHDMVLLDDRKLKQKVLFCPDHKDHALDYYCETCDKIVWSTVPQIIMFGTLIILWQ